MSYNVKYVSGGVVCGVCHLCGVPGQLEVGGVVDGPQPQQALVRRARVIHRRAHVVLAPRGKNIFCEVKIFSPGNWRRSLDS